MHALARFGLAAALRTVALYGAVSLALGACRGEPSSAAGAASVAADAAPDGVPEPYRIPYEVFASEVEFPRFENIAAEAGVGSWSLFGGVVTDDFDGDGWLDAIVTTSDVHEQIRYFHNNGNGTFSERTKEAGLEGLVGGLNVIQADYDNDGDLDVFVLRGAWLSAGGKQPSSLLRNEGGGRFLDVTFAAGIDKLFYPTQTGSWADYDNDGDVDLYVGIEHGDHLFDGPCQLWRNRGDGTFEEVAAAAGVDLRGFVKGVTWGDYDQDRFPDLYVSVIDGPNPLYRNQGDGTFVDVSESLGVSGPIDSFPVWFWDFNNDGALDLYAPSYRGTVDAVGAVAASYFGASIPWSFRRSTRATGAATSATSPRKWGSPSSSYRWARTSATSTTTAGSTSIWGPATRTTRAWCRTCCTRTSAVRNSSTSRSRRAWATSRRATPSRSSTSSTTAISTSSRRWEERSRATRSPTRCSATPASATTGSSSPSKGASNRAAIGARLRVDVVENGRQRSIFRTVNSGGSFGANPLRQHIGVGTGDGDRDHRGVLAHQRHDAGLRERRGGPALPDRRGRRVGSVRSRFERPDRRRHAPARGTRTLRSVGRRSKHFGKIDSVRQSKAEGASSAAPGATPPALCQAHDRRAQTTERETLLVRDRVFRPRGRRGWTRGEVS